MLLMRSLSATALLTLLTSGAIAQSSPFMAANPRGAKAAATSASTEPAKFEFTGIVNLGDAPLICITVVETQRSHWLKPGQSADGVALLSHDAATNQVVVRHLGRELPLGLKERTFDPNKLSAYQASLPSGPLPSAGLAERVPLTNEEKATEARMLVSDLLEIGMIQRKAYDEAKKQDLEAKREAPAAE